MTPERPAEVRPRTVPPNVAVHPESHVVLPLSGGVPTGRLVAAEPR